MKNKYKSKSRKETPWDDFSSWSETQKMIMNDHRRRYAERHRSLSDTAESSFINSHTPEECPYCKSTGFKKNGYSSNRIQKYKCSGCRRTFTPITGTIFENHKISIVEWIEYWRNLFQYLSLNADSWNNRNAYTTAKFWFIKTCLLLEDYQNDIVLGDTVWYDETMIPVVQGDIIRKANGQKLRGKSKNQMMIVSATDGRKVYLKYVGNGQPTEDIICESMKDHIAEGSIFVTDEDHGHNKLVKIKKLDNHEYNSNELKKMSDKENPLAPINHVHSQLMKFLNAHSGFNRDEIDCYLNMFAFMTNESEDKLKKVEYLLDLAFKNHKTLKYREYYAKKVSTEELGEDS